MPPTLNCTFHVGYAKAASTFLQSYFNSHPELYVIDRMEAIYHFVLRHDLNFSVTNTLEFFDRHSVKANSSGKKLVLSHERLCGNPHSGHYDTGAIARRINSIDNNARIILVIREQYDILASVYKQYLRVGGTRSTHDYFLYEWDGRLPRFDWSAYEYDRVVNFYCELFGSSRILVLLFEELQQNPEIFFNKLNKFIGISNIDNFLSNNTNISIPESVLGVIRICNYFEKPISSFREPNLIHYLDFFANSMKEAITKFPNVFAREKHGEKYSLAQKIKLYHPDRFRESNRRLAELLNSDLSCFGYEI